jgi:hypothetical protein
LNTNDLYADITNKNELVQIDPTTGAIKPIVTGLDNPHGLAFVPSASDTEALKMWDPSGFGGTLAGLGTGNYPTVGDGNHTANIALLSNYMASSFATSSDGHGGTLAAADQGTTPQPVLTHAHA